MQTQDNQPTAIAPAMANPLNSFSTERVKMVANYYLPIFRKQLWIYPLVGLLVGILFHVRELLTIFDVFFGLLSLAMSFMIYWSPIVLTGKDRTTEILLPARWSEKALVLLTYFLIILPLLTYGAYYLSYALISYLRTDTFSVINLTKILNLNTAGPLSIHEWLSIPVSYLNIVLPVSIFLFIVCRSPRPKAWQGLVFSVISTFALGIAVGIFVVVKVVTHIPDIQSGSLRSAEVERIINHSINYDALILSMGAALALASILFIYLTIRAIRKVQA